MPARGANRAQPRNGVLSLYVLYRSACHPSYSVTPPTTYMKQSDFTYPLVLSTRVQRVGDPLMGFCRGFSEQIIPPKSAECSHIRLRFCEPVQYDLLW